MAVELLASSESHQCDFADLDLEVVLAAIQQSAGDVRDSIALPPKLYNSERWFDFERAAIWDKEWICVGHASLIPNPGDYFSITVIDDPLLILRGVSIYQK